MDPNGLFLPMMKIAMIAIRVGALWMFFPVFSQGALPVMVRLAGALTLSVSLLPVVGPHLPTWSMVNLPETLPLLQFVLREFLIGAGMALVARWMFTACLASAQWAGTQMGFSIGGLLDPESQSSESAWSQFNQWIGIMVFFAIGGHMYFIQAVADSYRVDVTQVFPRITDAAMATQFWSEIGSRFFIWMLKLAGPMAVVILLLQMSMGVLSKFIPQVNIWSVSIPATIGVGVLVFTLFSPMYGDALASLFKAGAETNYLWLKYLGVR